MTGPDWLIWAVAIVLFVGGLALMCGKGSFLIAGYNTMSDEEKARFDEKKLCRATGALLLWTALLCMVAAAGALPGAVLEWLLPVGILVPVVGLVLYGNLAARKKR